MSNGYLAAGQCFSTVSSAVAYWSRVNSAMNSAPADLKLQPGAGVDYSAYTSPAPIEIPIQYTWVNGGITGRRASSVVLQSCEISPSHWSGLAVADFSVVWLAIFGVFCVGLAYAGLNMSLNSGRD